VVLALALGAGGGFLFYWVRLPLPWMLGAMVTLTIAAVAGAPVALPRLMRNTCVTVLGVLLGSQFKPELLGLLPQWGLSLSALVLWIVLATGVAYVYFRRVPGYDKITSYFAATPGGLNEMTIVGGQLGGDARIIALTHAARVLLVVLSIPIWYRFAYHLPSTPPGSRAGLGDLAWLDMGILTLCAVVGGFGAQRLRLPAANLLGPMVLSAALHLAGVTASAPPYVLVAVAQVVMGTALGCRFTGTGWASVARVVQHSAITTVIMLAFTVGFDLVLARLTGLSTAALVLAFAPGGLAEMSLVALALGADAAFVATHHLFRIIVIVVLAPVSFRFMRRNAAAPRPAAD
jgi:membrane AbrB-like protein